MQLSIGYVALYVALALAQSFPECTKEVVRTDACTSVIDANACYNKFGFRGGNALNCIEGTDAEKKKKICACCKCVGEVMCKWATTQKYC